MDERAKVSYEPNRGSVFLEDARVLALEKHPGNQFVLRVHAPRAARRAVPGSFAHLTCDASVPMRRPLSIMRASPDEGWLEFLYKPRGAGLDLLGTRRPGETVSVLAPIGHGFSIDRARPRLLALGGGVGIPPMIFLAETIRSDRGLQPLVLMGSEVPFPFELVESRLPVPGVRNPATHAVALLEQWGVPSRLASNAGIAGAHRGYITDLARSWLDALTAAQREETQVFACGPTPMLKAVAKLAREYDLPAQVALEEYMACGIGGCAGCTVLLQTPDGPAMKRVCVDGPVFDARQVYS
jgi:dihydroorotate dehydrogenase electron transfer subunit